jgi:NAD(P)-dependent dehydrogenase (short-subunit alcohol dehydrogenase family)
MDLTNKVCIVTGGTSGIGKETALALARLNARIVLPARNPELAAAVCEEIRRQTGNANVETITCELASFASIKKFAQAFCERYDRLDILLNNAGIMERARKVSRDGIELTWAVNHLAPFLLTKLLLPVMQSHASAESPARIVTVSSEAHRSGRIDFDDLEGKRKFNGFQAYGQSKLANILFTNHLASLFPAQSITANALHPGVVATNIFNIIPAPFRFLAKFFMLSPAEGAATSIYLASSDEVRGVSGKYFNKKKAVAPSLQALDAELAARLWQVSEDYAGV